MTTPLPKIRARYGEQIGVELFFQFPELASNPLSYLDADSIAGATSLTANGTDFTTGQYIILGQPGNEKTEIVQVHTVTAPTSTTIILNAATNFAHNRGDAIRFIPYNQIIPSFSTDGIIFTAASAINIRPDATETYLQRASDLSTYSYKFQFSNSTTSAVSAFSSVVTATGFADNTVWSVKHRALDQLGEQLDDLITDQFLNDSLMEARRWADQNPAVFRWSFRTKFGVVIGQMIAGQWRIAVPSDLRDPNTNKNILSIRIGDQNRPVGYQDRVRFNQNYLNVVHATVAVQQTSAGVTLVLSSTHDLPASGALSIANDSVGDGLIAIQYTANNKNTNTLSGVTGINRTVTVGTDVWMRPVFGLPTAYTIDAGFVYFDVPLKIDYDGMDAKTDYYSKIPVIQYDSDTFDEPFYDLYVPWLKWKIKYKKANGKIDRDGDTDYKDWLQGMGDLISQEFPSQRINFIPDVEGFLSSVE